MRNKKNQKNVTLHEVAKAAGVSVATVSYVLNNTGSVGKNTQQRVREAVARLGYRPNQSAQAMRTGKTRTLGLILPDLTNPFFPELAQSITNAARARGYAVFLVDAGEDAAEADGISHLIQQRVEGIIWCPQGHRDTLAEQASDLPAIVIDRPLPKYDSVCSDYTLGGVLLANYILAQGHTRVGVISGPRLLESANLRYQGLMETLAGRASIEWDLENPFSLALSQQIVDTITRKNVSIIAAGNDMIAIAAMQVLKRAGIRVPEDISIVGFDGIPWSAIVTPALTTVRQPLSQIGTEAVQLLMRRLEQPNAPRQQVILPVELIARDSVKLIK